MRWLPAAGQDTIQTATESEDQLQQMLQVNRMLEETLPLSCLLSTQEQNIEPDGASLGVGTMMFLSGPAYSKLCRSHTVAFTHTSNGVRIAGRFYSNLHLWGSGLASDPDFCNKTPY